MELIIDVIENSVVGVQISLHTPPEESLRRGCGRYETRSCFGLFLAVALPDNFLLDDISPGRKC